MDISVIIPTYNQEKRLEIVLWGLENQDFDPSNFEVIVIVDGSTDNTLEMLESIHLKNMKIIRFVENRGRCKARNQGIRSATGDLLVFLDGDALLEPEGLKKYWKAHVESGPDAVLCGFQRNLAMLEYLSNPQTGQLFDIPIPGVLRDFLEQHNDEITINKNLISHDFADLERRSQEGGYPFPETSRLQDETVELFQKIEDPEIGWLAFYPHNAAISSHPILRSDGFDERIPFCEGWELAYRLKKHGIPVHMVQATSYHLFHYHDFSSADTRREETLVRYRSIEYMVRKFENKRIRLLYLWFAHLWPVSLLPDEALIDNLIQFNYLYETMDENLWRQCNLLLTSHPFYGPLIQQAANTAREWMESTPPHNNSKKTYRQSGEPAVRQINSQDMNLPQLSGFTEARRERIPPDLYKDALEALFSSARQSELAGNLELASEILEKIRQKAGLLDNQHVLARYYSAIGFILQLRHHYKDAEKNYQNSLSICRENRDIHGEALSCGNLGNLCILRKNLIAAEGFFQRSLGLYQKIGDRAGIANQYNSLGNLKFLQNNIREAQGYLNEALDIDLHELRKEGLVIDYGLQNSISLALGKFDEAESLQIKVLDLSRELGDKFRTINACCSLAETSLRKGACDRAEEMIGMAMEQASISPIPGLMEKIYRLLSNIYQQVGTLSKTIENIADRKIELTSSNQVPALANACKWHGIILLLQKEDKAIDELCAAIDHYRSTDNRVGAAYSAMVLGEAWLLFDNPVEARKAYQKAIEYAAEIDNRYIQALSYTGLGYIESLFDHPLQTFSRWDMALKLFQDLEIHEKVHELEQAKAASIRNYIRPPLARSGELRKGI